MKIDHLIEDEIVSLQAKILTLPEYFDVNYVRGEYKKYAKRIFSNPFDKKLVKYVCDSLQKKTPLSVIRIGDGEINLITYTYYKSTPLLNYQVAQQSISRRCHQFKANKIWLIILQDLMMNAVYQADIIGQLGVWRPKQINIDEFISKTADHTRGFSGQWRSIDFMLFQAKNNIFKTKSIASAHLYFSIIKFLAHILSNVETVYLITNNTAIVKKLKKSYPNNQFFHINIQETPKPILNNEPDFLYSVFSCLPVEMKGTLTLVGAGIWAQIYCNWIKQKGGVAIDIGSGFDLMNGDLTRPIQRKMNPDLIQDYIL